MKLLVTGSRTGRIDVEYWLGLYLVKYGAPSAFICGGLRKDDKQIGVDEQAYQWALRNLDPATIVREYVEDNVPSPGCFHDRDQRMADHVSATDLALGFPVHGSKGTWLTLSMCRKRGARTYPCPRRDKAGA